MSSFSIGESIRDSWLVTKKNFGFLLVMMLLWLAVYVVISGIQNMVEDNSFFAFIFGLISYAVELLLGIGVIKITLALVDGRPATFQDLVVHYRFLARYFLASLLFGLMVAVGLLLFIIPGVIWYLKYQFYSYALLDKSMGVMESLQYSARITKGAKMDLFGLMIILMLLNLLGLLALLVGLFVTIPLTMIVMAYVYRKLEGKVQTEAVQTTPIVITPTPDTAPGVIQTSA